MGIGIYLLVGAGIVFSLLFALVTINPQNLPAPYLIAALGSLLGIMMVRRALPILKAYQTVMSAAPGN